MNYNQKRRRCIFAIGDPHSPFMHQDAVGFLRWAKQKYRPDTTVFLGDEIDSHGISHWPKDPDGYSAGHEDLAALEQLKPIYKLFPEAMVCTSNHTARAWRKAFDAGIPSRFIKAIHEITGAPPGWRWADKWIIDDIQFEHGEGLSGETAHIKAAKANMRSTVIGHVHSFAGINYVANAEKLIFGFNVGCLIDVHAYAFSYGKHIKQKPILGLGLIIDGVPQFVPMILSKNGRWVGK